MFFRKLLVHSLLFCSIVLCYSDTKNTDVIKYCNELRANRKLLLVSTLDGRLSALSIDEGTEKWSISTEPGPLLSSTIHHLELSENSQLVRIIPSLSGGLYKFDGESIEPMPVNTDYLLKSHWEDVDISGGKEIRSYAVDIESGGVLYECSMNECSNWTDNTYLNSDLILLRRETQKVRAVELHSRVERWNYSVGLHNITITHSGVPECINEKETSHITVKAVVPNGLIQLYLEESTKILWEFQFKSPIVSAWTLIGSNLKWVDLFKPVDSLSKKKKKSVYPTLYIGLHNEQLYIQENIPFNRNQLLFDKPRLSMKKYRLIHAIDIENKPDEFPLITDENERNSSTALAMLYGGTELRRVIHNTSQGYYLYCADVNGDCQTKKSRITIFTAAFLSLFFYWKEVIILITITFCLMHYLIPYPNITIFNIVKIIKILNEFSFEHVSSKQDSGISGVFCQTSPQSETSSYHSRYLEDFEPIHCLGKGGFGVVFQARHKVDDCHYAIKRIALPNREEARERVMREVKALAKLEHQYIVRYFQAWQECPPSGWQEEQDKLWKNKTKDEILSSEAEGISEISITSSVSHATNCDNRKLGVIVSTHRTSTEKSDSFIEFKYSNVARMEEMSTKSDYFAQMTQTVSSKQSSIASNRGRRKSLNKSNKTSRVYLYIQMQLCQKHSLREWLCDNLERDQNTILCMFDQIVQAVEYVHLQGLIHRDLKPSNIFFSPDGQIKVGDFGLVTEIIEDNDLKSESRPKPFFNKSRTANVGTKLYMSPEQVSGKPYNYKVDIYSLGIILFELLIAFPTQAERYRTLIDLRNNKFPSDFHVKYKDEYDLLSTMLSPYPEKRPTTYGIRSRKPFNKLESYNLNIPKEWHFDLPIKHIASNNKLRKSSTENV